MFAGCDRAKAKKVPAAFLNLQGEFDIFVVPLERQQGEVA